MMIPAQAIMVPQFKLAIALGLYGNIWSVILPESAVIFGVFLARQFFIAIPDELLEAARMDGAGHLRTFVSVVLPLCKPLLAVLTLLGGRIGLGLQENERGRTPAAQHHKGCGTGDDHHLERKLLLAGRFAFSALGTVGGGFGSLRVLCFLLVLLRHARVP